MAFSPQFIAGVDLLGAALLHFLWQAALIGVLYLLARRSCTSATGRYRLALMTMLGLALCPVLTFLYLHSHSLNVALKPAHAATLIGTLNVAADHAIASWHAHELLPWLVGLWLCGVLALAIRSLRQWARLSKLVAGATPLPAHWTGRLVWLSERFDVSRPIRLLSSALVPTPMLVGWIRPAILLPASMITGLAPDQLELVIAHELGHVRRLDYLVNLIQVVIETVLFYHPVVHWVSRDARNAREECCDDLVLQVARGDPLVYARTLADLEEMRQDLAVAAPALGIGGGVLLNRVRRIVGVSEALEPLPRSYVWPLFMVLAALLCVAWRSRPAPEDFRVVLAAVPAEAIALVSGNPHLAVDSPELPLQPIARPDVVAAPPRRAATTTSNKVRAVAAMRRAETDIAVDIARPGVHLSAASMPQLTNVMPPPVPAIAPTSTPAATAFSDATPAPDVQPLHVVAPVYPPRAMVQGVQGEVELQFHVDEAGRVHNIRVLNARPAGVFEAAARQALDQWRFPLAAAGSQAYSQRFYFSLKGKDADMAVAGCQHVTGTLICRHAGD